MADKLEVEVEEAPVEIPDEGATSVGSVIYEQDLRAAPHRNGWAPDLVDAAVGDDGPPPELPDEPSFGRRPEPGGSGKAGTYVLAVVYLAAGVLSLYVGITMLRDLRGNKKGDQA